MYLGIWWLYLHLPGNLDAISNPVIIGAALVMYVIEFVVDKVL